MLLVLFFASHLPNLNPLPPPRGGINLRPPFVTLRSISAQVRVLIPVRNFAAKLLLIFFAPPHTESEPTTRRFAARY